MPYQLRKIWKPWIFQGHNRKDHYFEGWYYKLVDPRRQFVLAIIPGIALNEKANDSHAFIQVFNSASNTPQYHRYSLDSFQASKKSLEVTIGDSRFTYDSIELNIDTEVGKVTGAVSLLEKKAWPIKPFRPGFMGWYAFVPFMQCYHGIVSFDHALSGTMSVDDREIDFTNGRGYTEKDWGTSFPKAWVWMQSNHFAEEDISFMCSVATIPWLGNFFTGFGAGFWYKGDFFPFTKWNGTKLTNLQIQPGKVSFSLLHVRYRIDVAATGEDAGELRSPVFGKMAGKVLESLKGEISISFSVLENDQWFSVFSGTGLNGGLEIMGDSEELVKGIS
ncbi:MAG: tocopherol cyclase family protein [Spirochaetota bacterium]|nr:tocopherol cyclase family protein [Spirochaetota bacterium]